MEHWILQLKASGGPLAPLMVWDALLRVKRVGGSNVRETLQCNTEGLILLHPRMTEQQAFKFMQDARQMTNLTIDISNRKLSLKDARAQLRASQMIYTTRDFVRPVGSSETLQTPYGVVTHYKLNEREDLVFVNDTFNMTAQVLISPRAEWLSS